MFPQQRSRLLSSMIAPAGMRDLSPVERMLVECVREGRELDLAAGAILLTAGFEATAADVSPAVALRGARAGEALDARSAVLSNSEGCALDVSDARSAATPYSAASPPTVSAEGAPSCS
jgi:hypothetical protein